MALYKIIRVRNNHIEAALPGTREKRLTVRLKIRERKNMRRGSRHPAIHDVILCVYVGIYYT